MTDITAPRHLCDDWSAIAITAGGAGRFDAECRAYAALSAIGPRHGCVRGGLFKPGGFVGDGGAVFAGITMAVEASSGSHLAPRTVADVALGRFFLICAVFADAIGWAMIRIPSVGVIAVRATRLARNFSGKDRI